MRRGRSAHRWVSPAVPCGETLVCVPTCTETIRRVEWRGLMTRRIGQIMDMSDNGKLSPGLDEHQVRGAALGLFI